MYDKKQQLSDSSNDIGFFAKIRYANIVQLSFSDTDTDENEFSQFCRYILLWN